MLQSGAADFCPVPLIMAEERFKYFYILYPFTYTDFTILSAVTRKNKISTDDLYIQPEIVYITLFILVIVATLLTVIDQRNGRNSEMVILWVNNFLTLFGTLTLQAPFRKSNNGTAHCLLMVCWWIPIVALVTTLVSLLISSMATASYELIDGVKDFDKFPKMCPTANFGGYFQKFFETSSDESTMQAWKRIQKCGSLVVRSELLTRRRFQDVVDKKIALLYDTESLLYAAHTVCDSEKMLHIATNQMETITFNFHMRKGFTWKLYEELNYRMMTYFEGGMYLSGVNKLTHRAERCLQRQKKPFSFITVDDVKLHFNAWFMGIAISCGSLILEILYQIFFERTGTSSRRTFTVTFKEPYP